MLHREDRGALVRWTNGRVPVPCQRYIVMYDGAHRRVLVLYWRSDRIAMSIIGHGIDIVAIHRIAGLIERCAEDFLEATFTFNERQEAESPETSTAFFAGRFAAKEAIVKALGTGFFGDIAWTDVEILRQPTGSPHVHLSGGALAVAQSLGVTHWLLSISHDESYAIASAIALGDAYKGITLP
jgi:holo-[acyl-carrier protein] synthase